MKKILFLDIDGVLRLDKSDDPTIKHVSEQPFNRLAVVCLNELHYWVDYQIVITSTWRIYLPFSEIITKFEKERIFAEVIDATPTLGIHRGLEIQHWLDEHGIPDYLIIDDQINDITPYHLANKIIHCDPKDGFIQPHLNLAIDQWV